MAVQLALTHAHVLVVDDVDTNVEILTRMLLAAGVGHVDGLTDPRLVVAHCLEHRPDLVLLDISMPHMDGIAVLEALHVALPADACPLVIVLTGDITKRARHDALTAGAKDFLTRPFDRDEVLLRVRNHLETRALYTLVLRENFELRAELDRRRQPERDLATQQANRLERIRHVIDGDALGMVFQPIVDLDCGDVVGVEALARFAAPPRRPPNEWFAEGEQVGLGVELELAAITRAFAQLSDLPRGGFLAVNVSPATAVTSELRACLNLMPGRQLVVELTEHTRIHDYQQLQSSFDQLRGHGVRIAVDDAGSGYAGLQHILRLRPDIVKLDLELTRAIHVDPARRALATSLVSFAREIGAVLVAEGIEGPEQLETLRKIGVPWGQGYHLGLPGPLPIPARS